MNKDTTVFEFSANVIWISHRRIERFFSNGDCEHSRDDLERSCEREQDDKECSCKSIWNDLGSIHPALVSRRCRLRVSSRFIEMYLFRCGSTRSLPEERGAHLLRAARKITKLNLTVRSEKLTVPFRGCDKNDPVE